MNLRLDVLSEHDCHRVRDWRNADISGLRTPHRLTEQMQSDFYRDVVSSRSSVHRYFAVRDGALAEAARAADRRSRGISLMHFCSDAEVSFVGCGGLTNIEHENGVAEISLIIAPEHQRRGYGRAAVDLLLKEAFERLRLRVIFGEVYMNNPAAAFWFTTAQAKGGYWTTLPKRRWWNGRAYDVGYFSVEAPA